MSLMRFVNEQKLKSETIVFSRWIALKHKNFLDDIISVLKTSEKKKSFSNS